MLIAKGHTLPKIAFVGRYDENKVSSVWNYDCRPVKPNGGFWTSPYCGDGTYWEDYCYDKEYWGRNRCDVIPNPDINVWVIEGQDDVEILNTRYHWDWTQVAQDFDAVYVTQSGVGYLKAGCWDVPTVLFFNTDAFAVQV
jgi:hypothetical protein